MGKRGKTGKAGGAPKARRGARGPTQTPWKNAKIQFALLGVFLNFEKKGRGSWEMVKGFKDDLAGLRLVCMGVRVVCA